MAGTNCTVGFSRVSGTDPHEPSDGTQHLAPKKKAATRAKWNLDIRGGVAYIQNEEPAQMEISGRFECRFAVFV